MIGFNNDAGRAGYTLAKTLVERRDEFGVSWFLIDDLSRLSRNTIARAYDFASPHE